MSEDIRPLLVRLAAGADDLEAWGDAFALVLAGEATDAQLGAFLALSASPAAPRTAMLVAGARAMRARMTPIEAPHGAIDVCGTGGDGAQTLNVSTAVAFVAAGAGVPVAKHGNRAASSRSGAADVLEALGVNLAAPTAALERSLREAKVAFLFAQTHHPALKPLAAPRREVGFRSIFNLLGPLANPAGVRRQLVGVADPRWLGPMAEALGALGAEVAWTIHGAGGLDEATPEGETRAFGFSGGSLHSFAFEPATAGLEAAGVDGLKGGAPEENAAALRRLLAGEDASGAYRRAVELNAAAALTLAGVAQTLREGAELARASIESGAAEKSLMLMAAISRGEA